MFEQGHPSAPAPEAVPEAGAPACCTQSLPSPAGRYEPARPPRQLAAAWSVRAADRLLWLYQKTVSPALASLAPSCGCRFAPTCSQYAREALREHGLLAGLGLSACRLAQCGPWHPGGFDPVPARPHPVCRRETSLIVPTPGSV